jgi:uncharacterized membrane protein
MPAFFANLPLHPLVVHAVVVLVPLTVLCGIAIAVRPTLRRHFGWPTVALAALTTAIVPIATDSGEALRDRLEPDPLIATHAELGDQLLAMVAPLAVVLAALMYLDQRGRATPKNPSTTTTTTTTTKNWIRPTTITLAAATVVLAALCAVQVVRIGDSGARAVWHDTQYITPTRNGD